MTSASASRPGVGYDFPFQVSVDIADNIGGPSAGLMMSLAIYDTLTPGSLTGGADIAGTGTITPAGKVGPIGGIQQKIAAARDAGAELFLVPADNCDAHRGSGHGRHAPGEGHHDGRRRDDAERLGRRPRHRPPQLRGDRLMTSPTDPTPDAVPEPGAPDALPEDPALAAAILEIEAHVAQEGWDQPARLYALVDTATLVAQEPALAAAMAIDGPGADGSFTPIEQDGLPPGQVLEDALHTIAWPESVAGCAAVIERLVLPPDDRRRDPRRPDRRGAVRARSTPTARRCGWSPA